jgi:hypothetical protein
MKRFILSYQKTIGLFLLSAICFSGNVNAQMDSCTFVETNGILTVEMESANISNTYWLKKTDVPDYTGNGYLEYQGGDATGVPGKSVISYTFRITTPGRYSFKARAYRTKHYDNDVWVRFPAGGVMTKINGDSTGAKNDEWFKFMIGARNVWSYFMKTQYTGQGEVLHDVYVDFPAAGVYTVQFAGRTTGFKLDRFTLYRTSGFYGMNSSNPESPKENCVPYSNQGPYVANIPEDKTYSGGGGAFSFALPSNTFIHPLGMGMGYVALLKGYNPLPAWLSFNASTRTFTGNPIWQDGGVYEIIVKAQDANSRYAVTGFKLTILGNRPPVLATEISNVHTVVGQPFSLTFDENIFTDADGHVLTYSAHSVNNFPMAGWLSFNAGTRTFSGTPGVANIGPDTIIIVADDNNGGSAEARFIITVSDNHLPVLSNPIPDQMGREGEFFSFTFNANAFTDEDGDELTYTLALHSGDNLPAWLLFNADTRTFSGTPRK